MWLDWMLAPALVPAITTPRWCAARIASPNGVPLITPESFSLVAAGHEDAGHVVEHVDEGGVARLSRDSGRAETTSAAPSLLKIAS